MSRLDQSNQPAREANYRRLYMEVRKLHERVVSQDESITWLLIELRAAQKRIEKLEQHNALTATRLARMTAVKLAN